MGHLGLTPQSVHKLGGYSVQGREEDKAMIMKEDSRILEDAGVFSLVLEMVPEKLATDITETLEVPTIGIGAGRHTDGQVLVITDLLGYDASFNPKFLKKYADIHNTAMEALKQYKQEVGEGSFPGENNVFS
jgi:3-methyl-2-oxobutanoate hydroxymethyltransferase